MGSEVDNTHVLDLDSYKLEGAPETIYYIPDFINEEEEKYLMKKVNEAPIPKWTQLSNRRLQNWGGDPHPKGMISERIPDWLKRYVDRISGMKDLYPTEKKPNHVLVNEYLPGQGIMPHLDGPLFYPIITTISLGSHAVLNFYRPLDTQNECSTEKSTESMDTWSDRLEFSVYVEPRSLLVLKEKVYEYFLHGIDQIGEDDLTNNVLNSSRCSNSFEGIVARGTRISLTIRHVPGAKKSILKLLGK